METILPLTIFIALLFIGLGLIQLFAPDLAWEFAQVNNGMFGRSSERTPVWERWRVFFGILSILAGLGILLLVGGAIDVQNARHAAAERQALAHQLHQEFQEMLWVLEANATDAPQSLSADALGTPQAADSRIFYGKCAAGYGFYILILNHWGGLGDVAYTNSSREARCLPSSLYTLTGNEQLLGKIGFSGRWLQLQGE